VAFGNKFPKTAPSTLQLPEIIQQDRNERINKSKTTAADRFQILIYICHRFYLKRILYTNTANLLPKRGGIFMGNKGFSPFGGLFNNNCSILFFILVFLLLFDGFGGCCDSK